MRILLNGIAFGGSEGGVMSDNMGAPASQTGLSQQAAEPEVSALPGFDSSRVEFRPDNKGEFDELVAYFANGLVFFEDLGENGLFVDIVWNDKRGVRLWAAAKRGCLRYSHESDFDETAQAIEAGTAETVGLGPQDESAVRKMRPEEVAQLQTQYTALREGLRDAIHIFDNYAEMHEAKGTEEGRQKAQRNRDHANAFRTLLSNEASR